MRNKEKGVPFRGKAENVNVNSSQGKSMILATLWNAPCPFECHSHVQLWLTLQIEAKRWGQQSPTCISGQRGVTQKMS